MGLPPQPQPDDVAPGDPPKGKLALRGVGCSRTWGLPFSGGYLAAAHAYRNQAQELSVGDLRALLNLGATAACPGAALGSAFGDAPAEGGPCGGRVLVALRAVWGRALLRVAALEALAAVLHVAAIFCLGVLLRDVEFGRLQAPSWFKAVFGRAAEQSAFVHVASLVVTCALGQFAQQCALHWRAKLVSEAEVSLKVWAFRRHTSSPGPQPHGLGSLMALLPQLSLAWVRRSLSRCAVHAAGALLALWPLVHAVGWLGLVVVPVAACAFAVEAAVKFRYGRPWQEEARAARQRREALAGELLSAIACVKQFAWERLYFKRHSLLRIEEREALRRESRSVALACALRTDLLLILQAAACVCLGAALYSARTLSSEELRLWRVFQAWAACRLVGEQLRGLRDALASPRLTQLAATFEAALAASGALREPPRQGDQASYKAAKHAIAIEGMRFFWGEELAVLPAAAAGAGASSPKGPTSMAASAVGHGPSALASGVGSTRVAPSTIDPADFAVNPAPAASAAPKASVPTRAAAVAAAAAAAGPPDGHAAMAAAKAAGKRGLELADLVTDSGSVAERAARAVRGSTGFDLKVLSFQVKRGSLVALVSATGSGKSTLFAALRGTCRQACWGDDPEGTGITISGRLAYVPQKPVLMRRRSVRDNILCGLPWDPARYERALSTTTLVEDLARLPQGDATELAEVSSAATQMCVQLARAVYHEADIMLLDDPFVDLEGERAARLMAQGVKKWAKERTVLLATQNLSLLAGFSLIVVLRNGTVFEQGDHKTLSSMPTEFSRLSIISSQKDAARALRRQQLSTKGVPCPFLCYEVDADPMDEVFPFDREIANGACGYLQDLGTCKFVTGDSEVWLSQKGQLALAPPTPVQAGPWDTQWSTSRDAGGVTVRDGQFFTTESHGIGSRTGLGGPKPRPAASARERLGAGPDRRRGFVVPAEQAAAMRDVLESQEVVNVGSPSSPSVLGRGHLRQDPDGEWDPHDASGSQGGARSGQRLLAEVLEHGDWQAPGLKPPPKAPPPPSSGADPQGEAEGLHLVAPAAPGSGQELPSRGRSCWAARMAVRGSGLASLPLLLVFLLCIGLHLSVPYLAAYVLTDAAPATLAPFSDPDGETLNSSAGSEVGNPSTMAPGDAGGNGTTAVRTTSSSVVWRGFGDTQTGTSTSTTSTRTTIVRQTLTTTTTTVTTVGVIVGTSWASNVSGQFCRESGVSPDSTPGTGFRCDANNGCSLTDLVPLADCEQTCLDLVSSWGCRYISWGGPDTALRYCYVLHKCTETMMLPSYRTLALSVTYQGGRRLTASRMAQASLYAATGALWQQPAFRGAAPTLLALLCAALAGLALGQTELAARVAASAGHEASAEQLRSVLAAPESHLGDRAGLRRGLSDDVTAVDRLLTQHLSQCLLTLVHIAAAIAALLVVVIGAGQAALGVGLALAAGLSAYLHRLRLPLLQQLDKLQRDAEAAALLRAENLEECHEVFRAHGRLHVLCEEFEASCHDSALAAMVRDLADRWLCTRILALHTVLLGLLGFAVLAQTGPPSSEEPGGGSADAAPTAVALLLLALLPGPLRLALRHAAALHGGAAALQRMRRLCLALPAEELDSPALRMRPPSASELRDVERGRAAARARLGRQAVLGDSAIERGSPEEQAAALLDLARLEREQGISVAGFPLEQVADDWPYFGAVEVENVTATYAPGGLPALRDVTLQLPAAKSMLLVGPEKSGKTSLLRAILRLCPVESGRVVVDSIDVRSVGLATLRSRVAFVPQETVLFEGTWRTNLDPMGEFSEEHLGWAVRLTRLHNWLALNAPRGLDEPVPTGPACGPELKALLGLSRALLRLLQRRSKLLLLDRTTCALDASSDADLTALVLRYCKRRHVALLQASRRVTQAALYDLVAVMQDGRVVEQGPAKKLWAKDAALRTLARTQGVDAASLTKAEVVADRLTSVWAWDTSPQEDPAWSDEFAVSMKKVKEKGSRK